MRYSGDPAGYCVPVGKRSTQANEWALSLATLRFKKHCVRRCSVITQTMFATNPASPPNEKQVELPVQLVFLCRQCRDFARQKPCRCFATWTPSAARDWPSVTIAVRQIPASPPSLLYEKATTDKKAQVTRVSCAFLLLYLVFLSLDKIFEFNSCISALFSKNRSWTYGISFLLDRALQFYNNF